MKNINTDYPLLNHILFHRRVNIIIALISFVATVIYVFFIADKKYTAEVSILPPTASFSSGLTGSISDISKLAGIDLGGESAQSPEMFSGILKSRKLLEKTIYKEYTAPVKGKQITGNFIFWHEIDGDNEREIFEKALKEFREEVMYVEIDNDNSILYLSITTVNPELSAQIANYMVNELNIIVQNEVQKEYRQQLAYLNKKVEDAKDSLNTSENSLKEFIETHSDLTIPEYQFMSLRLQRNIRINTEIYIEFRKQLETFILENMINLSEIKVLDKAFPPYRKSRPKRALLAISIFLLAILLQIAVNAGILIFKNIFKTNTISE